MLIDPMDQWAWLEEEVERIQYAEIPWTAENQEEAVDYINEAFRQLAA